MTTLSERKMPTRGNSKGSSTVHKEVLRECGGRGHGNFMLRGQAKASGGGGLLAISRVLGASYGPPTRRCL
jgi:hypothetical protein